MNSSASIAAHELTISNATIATTSHIRMTALPWKKRRIKNNTVANPAGNTRNGKGKKTLKGNFGELPIK